MVDKVLGAKVRIEVNEEGSYEGYVHNIDQATNKLTLVKVTSCSNGTRIHGLHHFFPKEITKLVVLEQKLKIKETDNVKEEESDNVKVEELPRDKEKVSTSSQSPNNLVETSKHSGSEEINKTHEHRESSGSASNRRKESRTFYNSPLPSRNARNFSKRNIQKGKPMRRDPSDEGPSLLQRRPLKPSSYYSEVFADTTDERENFTVNPPDVVIIDSVGEMFEKAVAYILRQRVVGVTWEGSKVGRFGKLCLIQIGCNKCIYIFDIVLIGRRAFDCGLADIMDSGDLLKVIHNCRHFSDSLNHQYGVSLVNVFDTQVADVIIYRNEMDGVLPRQTSSLISSLYEYLDLCPDEYHFHKIRQKHTKDDEFVWEKRPLPKDLVDAAAKTVMYLRELRLAQMERMMAEFIFGVDIYLSSVRDAPDENVKKKYSSTALPETFHQLHKRRDKPRYRQLDPELDGNNGQEERRRAWQEGHTFMEKCEKRGMRLQEHKYPLLTNDNTPQLQNDLQVDVNSVTNDLTTDVRDLNISEETFVNPQEQNVCRIPEDTRTFQSPAGSNVALLPIREGLFSQDDFPQLSSTDSDSSERPPASSSVDRMRDTRLSPMNSRDTKSGRGRARALHHNAELPSARLPRDNRPGIPSKVTIGVHDRLQFPTDEELLSVPEILLASDLRVMPTGARVRVSHR